MTTTAADRLRALLIRVVHDDECWARLLAAIEVETSAAWAADELTKLLDTTRDPETVVNINPDHPELSLRGVAVRLRRRRIIVTLEDGREVSDDIDRHPELERADALPLLDYALFADGRGVEWPKLDVQLSVYGIARDCGLLDVDGRLIPPEAS